MMSRGNGLKDKNDGRKEVGLTDRPTDDNVGCIASLSTTVCVGEISSVTLRQTSARWHAVSSVHLDYDYRQLTKSGNQ